MASIADVARRDEGNAAAGPVYEGSQNGHSSIDLAPAAAAARASGSSSSASSSSWSTSYREQHQ
jgi:hypothetical protein